VLQKIIYALFRLIDYHKLPIFESNIFERKMPNIFKFMKEYSIKNKVKSNINCMSTEALR
jgi:hypothetical protein